MEKEENKDNRPCIWGLAPAFVLLVTFLLASVLAGDFYAMPISVSFVIASATGIAMLKGPIDERMGVFSDGIRKSNILYMVWIFTLAGMFAQTATATGAVDSTVAMTLSLVPSRYLPAGIFLASCLLSMAIGTSVGTVVALTPIVSGIAEQTGADTAWIVGIVIGGAFFGDNLSFISDTTIAATQSQGCKMRDKFSANLKIALPAALAALVIYATHGLETNIENQTFDWWLSIPYLLVIVLSICGINVILVLFVGILAAYLTGILTGVTGITLMQASGQGILSMSELTVISLLAGGMMATIYKLQGLRYLLQTVTKRVSGCRGAQLSMVFITAATNLCTANNTIAIITTGNLAKEVGQQFGISPKRMASILDTTSCIVQGLLPYGAQLLMAASLASVSPLQLVGHCYYQFLLAGTLLLSIIFTRKH